jgi:DNA-binding transcriptional ArsR family regulator
MCCPGDEKLHKKWIQDIEKEHESIRFSSKEIADKLKIISNPERVEILLMLSRREHCLEEMARKLRMPKPAISYHLGLLKKHNLICVIKRSRYAFYSLSYDGKRIISIFQKT